MTEYNPTVDCEWCECPLGDHIALRYFVKCWWRHLFLRIVSKPLSKIRDTNASL